MSGIVIVDTEEDINEKDEKDINEEDINEKVDFYDIYEEILKMSDKYSNNLTKRPATNIKMIKREAIWFDKQLLR